MTRWYIAGSLNALALCWLMVSSAGCKKDSSNPAISVPTPLPARILAISPTPRQDPPATTADILAAIDLSYNSGARGQSLVTSWRTLEPSPGIFSLNDVGAILTYLGTVKGFGLQVGLAVINRNVRETPADLLGVAFDAPQMLNRFHALLDAILPLLNRNVLYLSIGSEVDLYFSEHPSEWSAYRAFYYDAVRYVHQRSPSLKIGVTTTYTGVTGIDSTNIRALNDSSNVVILTYYPVGSQFIPRPPSVVSAEFARMVSISGGRAVILQEVGYPDSTTLGSSELIQQQFVTAVFTAWNAQGTAIPFLNFFCMHDLTPRQCDSLAQYFGLPNNQSYKDFLGSLGFRTGNGTPRLAWQTFVDSASRISKRQE